ncbi:bifunctional 3'-5' exonuclease/DNA polymerase [Spirillospora sp. NPDC048819]|uniref:bifunctional 3'-5' exonuclease/DNA polymerase n=1 Tax=Spirillospora sp. NPDC048819 TaxID=3155268 RepID=UPI0033E7E4BA
MRIAVAAGARGGGALRPLGEDGTPAGPVQVVPDLAAAIAEREAGEPLRWVWSSTARIYPRLLDAGVRVGRCHDLELVESLLLGHAGRYGEPRSVRAAWARLRGEPVPADRPPHEESAQVSLFGDVDEGEEFADDIEQVVAVHAEQQRTIAGLNATPSGTRRLDGGGWGLEDGASSGARRLDGGGWGLEDGASSGARRLDGGGWGLEDGVPGEASRSVGGGPGGGGRGAERGSSVGWRWVGAGGRFALLAAAESAGSLVAAEMSHDGLPWSAQVHDALLTELLGPRPSGGLRPRRLQDLADRISAAFGPRVHVNPDSPAQILKAFAAAGLPIPSTRAHVLKRLDHPAVPLLLEYKELARLHTAHGWAWLDTWVSGGRFRPEYVVGGVVSGRWATSGGGALQIPRVLRKAVVADPGWSLVVADAAQLEPRVLAALAGDRAFTDAAAHGDLYEALSDAFRADPGRPSGTRRLEDGGLSPRDKAKLALLSAMYGGGTGEAVQLLAVLKNRFPDAFEYVEAAARAGERGRLVRSRLGRTCPPPSAGWRELTSAGDDDAPESRQGTAAQALRSRGRFTRNFVVQATAADWALALLGSLRRRLTALGPPSSSPHPPPFNRRAPLGAPSSGPHPPPANRQAPLDGPSSSPHPPPSDRRAPLAPRLVFFQHDEVIVHTPAELAEDVVAAVHASADEARRLLFGDTPVVFPMEIAVVDRYADAK